MLKSKATVATVYSQTRFSSSAYVQWKQLVSSFGLFVDTLCGTSGDKMLDEDDPLQYTIKGQVIFLLSSCDFGNYFCTVSTGVLFNY